MHAGTSAGGLRKEILSTSGLHLSVLTTSVTLAVATGPKQVSFLYATALPLSNCSPAICLTVMTPISDPLKHTTASELQKPVSWCLAFHTAAFFIPANATLWWLADNQNFPADPDNPKFDPCVKVKLENRLSRVRTCPPSPPNCRLTSVCPFQNFLCLHRVIHHCTHFSYSRHGLRPS